VLRDWLKKLLGRSGSVSPAEEARVKHQIDSDAMDRYAGRVMGVYGDIGPTVPSPESPTLDRLGKIQPAPFRDIAGARYVTPCEEDGSRRPPLVR
jgi:hypothetical protein